MRIVFDLDGTLVHTREAVRHAYRLAGVEMPEDAHGKPFHEWCDDNVIHQRKHIYYPAMVKCHAKRTTLFEECLRRDMCIDVITGASMDAVSTLRNLQFLPWKRVQVHAWSLNVVQKIDWLARHGWGLYVDDDISTRVLTRELTTWKVLSPEECVRLFLQLGPTQELTRSLLHLENLSS